MAIHSVPGRLVGFAGRVKKLVPRRARFARQPFRLQAFAVVMKGLFRGFVLAHGLFGVRTPFGVSGRSLFRGEYSRRASREGFSHGNITPKASEGSRVCFDAARLCPGGPSYKSDHAIRLHRLARDLARRKFRDVRDGGRRPLPPSLICGAQPSCFKTRTIP